LYESDLPMFNVVEPLHRCTFYTRWQWHSLHTWRLQRQKRAS